MFTPIHQKSQFSENNNQSLIVPEKPNMTQSIMLTSFETTFTGPKSNTARFNCF